MPGPNLSRWAVNRPTLVLFLILILCAAGALSYSKLGRAEDPPFTIKNVNIIMFWPGSSATEMRDQVADLVEKKLQELPNLDRIDTYAKPGFMSMAIAFKDSTPPALVPQLFYQTRKKLWDIQRDLPSGVIGPIVNDEYGDVDSVLYAVSGDNADYHQLHKIVEDLRKRLLRTPDATKVNVYGDQDRKIFVEFSTAKLANLALDPQSIFDSLAKQNAVNDAGAFETSSARVRVQASGELTGGEAIAALPVAAKGQVLRLGDIATITPGYEDPPSFLVRNKGQPAILVGVVMARGANILTFGQNLAAAIEEERANMPIGVEIEQIADQPKVVDTAVGEFLRSFLEALAIVLLVSFASLGLRTGVIVALSVPVVLAVVFIFMGLLGIDLQRISLGALIIALGLLVDDAIIAVESMMVKMEQGYDRMKAATFAWESTAFPMLTGTLITAAGFMPVGFSNSSVGEFTGSMFWVLLVALISSWFVAVIVTPYLGVKLLPDLVGHAHADADAIYQTGPYLLLRRIITWSVDHRGRVVATTVLVFVLAALGFVHVQKQFFPLSERPELFFQMRLPQGSSMSASLEAARQGEALLQGDEDAKLYTSYIGQGPPRFWIGLFPEQPNEAYAEIVIVTKDLEARERLKKKIETALAQGALPQARVRIDRFNYGPPVGFPVQFRVIGGDPLKLRAIADEARKVMQSDDAIVDPHFNWNELTPNVRLVIDQDRARLLGLTPQDVSQRLRMLISGLPVTTVRDGPDQVEVIARSVASERGDLSHLGDMIVFSNGGQPVSVSQIAKIEYGHEDAIFWRRNRNLAITLRADVKSGVQPPDVSARLWSKLENIRAALPLGYRMEMGGAIEESDKANTSIAAVFPAVILIMLTIVMAQLQNFTRLGLVLMSAPLGIIGASIALNLANAPFGFVALLGLIALSGMDMRNSIILVDQMRQDLEHGASYREAIIGSTVRRARPVALTALAAILAMIPLTRSLFWGPMALTIMGGLFVATFMTILFLPALYALWFRQKVDQGLGEAAGAASSQNAPMRATPGGAQALANSALEAGSRLASILRRGRGG